MKKVLVGLLMVIPLMIVGAVLLITEVVLLTPDIRVSGVEIVDEYQVKTENIEVENFVDGKEYQLYARVLPRKANNKEVFWSIDLENAQLFNPDFDGEIAEVTQSGLVILHSTGTFDVVVTTDDGGYTARCSFKVNSDVATDGFIVIDGRKSDDVDDELTISTDRVFKLDACARPTDVNIEYVMWEVTQGGDVISIDQNGIIVPKKAGTAKVKMTIKSYDKTDSSGTVTKYALPITDEITVNVTSEGAVFAVPSYTTSAQRVSLSTLGASGATLSTSSSNCKISEDGTHLEFTSTEGAGPWKAVFVKGERSITVRRYASGDAVDFENFDALNRSTIILGKIPLSLKLVYGISGLPVDKLLYTSSDDKVAEINPEGKITAKSEGSVTFTAYAANGQICAIDFQVKAPVIYFKLESYENMGIARERIFGNRWYNENGELTTTRMPLKIIQPVGIDNSRFTWVCDNSGIVSVSENGEITVQDFDGERTVTVTVTAKESPYAIDKIERKYTFRVRKGINVRTAFGIKKAAAEWEQYPYDIYMQGDICFENLASSDSSWQLSIYRNFFGNGHMLSARYLDVSDTGVDIMKVCGDNITVSNVIIQSSPPPEDGSFSSSSFSRKCIEVQGKNVRVEYSQFEYARFCMSVYSPDCIIDGCVFSNASRFGLFSWINNRKDGEGNQIIQNTTVKNCILGISAATAIGFSNGDDDAKCNLKFEGFCDIYNWKQTVDMDMIGDITDNSAVNAAIREVLNSELNKKEYNEYFLFLNGVKYMHCGMLLMGFDYNCGTVVTGAVEENDIEKFEVNFRELSSVGPLLQDKKSGWIYSYCKKGPVMPGDAYSLNDATCKVLREGKPASEE